MILQTSDSGDISCSSVKLVQSNPCTVGGFVRITYERLVRAIVTKIMPIK